VEFRSNRALGACNPPCAYLGRQQVPMIGSMLPYGIVVQQTDPGVEVDPVGSMAGVANQESTAVAGCKCVRLQAGIRRAARETP